MQESSGKKHDEIEEADIAQLETTTATQQYLKRIEKIDKSGPTLNAVIEVNPAAQADACRPTGARYPTSRKRAR